MQEEVTQKTITLVIVQVGNKSLINRHKFKEFLNQTTSL